MEEEKLAEIQKSIDGLKSYFDEMHNQITDMISRANISIQSNKDLKKSVDELSDLIRNFDLNG